MNKKNVNTDYRLIKFNTKDNKLKIIICCLKLETKTSSSTFIFYEDKPKRGLIVIPVCLSDYYYHSTLL